jgi:DNA segregation ATPase FtsK/SpoIIIE, S-DNA-T family
MTQTSLIDREKKVLREVALLAAERVRAEQAATEAFQSGVAATKCEFERAVAEIERRLQAEMASTRRDLQAAQSSLTAKLNSDRLTTESRRDTAIEQIINASDLAERQLQKALDEARWLARTVYEAERKRMTQLVQSQQKRLRGQMQNVLALRDEAAAWMRRQGLPDAVGLPAPSEESEAADRSAERLAETLNFAHAQLRELTALRLPKLARGAGLVWMVLAVAALLVPATGWLADWRPILWIGLSVCSTAAAGVSLVFWLRKLARVQVSRTYLPLAEALHVAETHCTQCLVQAERTYKRQRIKNKRQREQGLRQAAETHLPLLAACRERREAELLAQTSAADGRLIAAQREFETEARRAAERDAQRRAAANQAHEESLGAAETQRQRTLQTNEARFGQARLDIVDRWRRGLAAAQAEITEIRSTVAGACPDWDALVQNGWQPAQTLPTAIRFGRLSVSLAAMTGRDVPRHLAAEMENVNLDLPALLDFPNQASLYVKAQDAGRRTAVDLLQVVMLRLLTAVPPGKVRFTIIDPVGLGQNFAAFMHLADYDEALVGHRIWTEPSQIEQRLTDVTEHMETVIQKYLRNEFATIQAYNEEAGEIAEPFRILVVANFPAGFTEAAARRLLSIAASGPRCGVHVLLSVDAKLPPLRGIDLADLQRQSAVFSTSGERFVWQNADFKHLPLRVDVLPHDHLKDLIQAVGKCAVAAKRVEVPFEAIAPPPDDYWTFDTQRGIDVPLGRAGATRLQHLRLGQGTSQHVLIAGKTGSGKTTLLHALITNAALRYSPDELELYLIDFKKGVEFKTYATHALPHARVIAIESEREFGLSVMQRLDTEMRLRGDRFRELGVQDIAACRDAGVQLPRILLIVDEFQEFFVEDDKLAQEAALLLDRLVRQGRAFGIHVHLGSQTLCGAYSLARSTLGQMAVRIALQCSEADAQVILSEDNPAARLLSRPGEAIYNDANGLLEGNHLFQVVWLPDDRRELYLRQIQRLAAEQPAARPRTPVVFEGSRPADIEKSRPLAELLDGATYPSASTAPQIWLGEPLAFDAATTAAFPRRGGANLLWLGQNDEAAAGMLLAAVFSLAAQLPPTEHEGRSAPTQFYVLFDGTNDDGYGGRLHRLSQWLPQRVRRVGAGEAAMALAELAEEMARRQASGNVGPPRFLLIFDLPRFRDLRHMDDDFGFSRSAVSDVTRPDRQLADLLRDGPPLGLHTLVWCDTLTNFHRMLERQALKEFETRVLLQMSVGDSSLLIDTPAASQLGRMRALLHREDEGRLEKFRPFAVPSDKWLQGAGDRIARRGARESTETPTTGAAPTT